MDFSRYEKLRTLVRANFSEQTQRLVDEALEYADGKLAGLVRYDGSPLLDHAVNTKYSRCAFFPGLAPAEARFRDCLNHKPDFA